MEDSSSNNCTDVNYKNMFIISHEGYQRIFKITSLDSSLYKVTISEHLLQAEPKSVDFSSVSLLFKKDKR